MIRAFALAILLSGCASSRGLLLPDEGGASWTVVASPHFQLETNLPQDEADESIQYLERLRQALVVGLWPGQASPPGRLEVVVLAKPAELLPYAQPNIGGFVTTIGPDKLMVVAGDREYRARFGLVPHEMVHWLASFFLRRQPRWVGEGLATYAETVQVSLIDPRVMLGYAHTGRATEWQDHRVPLAQLVNPANAKHFMPGDPEGNAHYYGSAWMLVHYLRHAQPTLFQDLMRRLAAGEEPQRAWDATLGQYSAEQLDRDITRYGLEGSYQTVNFILPLARVETTSRPLSAADTHGIRALLRASCPRPRRPGDWATIRADVAAALKADPYEPRALMIRAETDGLASVSSAALQAPLTHPDDWHSWWLALRAAAASPELQSRLEPLLQSAVARFPDAPWLVGLMSRVQLDSGHAVEAFGFARRAAALAPWDPKVLEVLSSTAMAVNRCDEAVDAERRAMEMTPDRTAADEISALLDRLTALEQRCAVARTEGESLGL